MNENQVNQEQSQTEPNPENYTEHLDELVKDLTVEPEILEEPQKECIFCNARLNGSFSFCTQCGKEQILPKEEPARKIVKPVSSTRPKKTKNHPVAFGFSILSFSFSFIAFLVGFTKMIQGNAPSISIFGTDSSTVIFNAGVMISCFLISILFSLLGMFLYQIKKD